MKRIHKVAVLGAGTMGSRIAAHFANAGIPSYLFDIVPPDADAPMRNKIAGSGLEGAKKSKPAAFFEASLANLVTIGNFEDDLKKIGEVDWVIEAVVENLEIKRGLLRKVENDSTSSGDQYITPARRRGSRRPGRACPLPS
jgi:3-hydroxyacyl-CoA dehydrogenase